MRPIPKDPAFDGLPGLLKEGYRYISNRCRVLGSDAFSTRLLFLPALCISGEDAAKMFYGEDHFTRRLALPPTALLLLQDYGSVNRLDGVDHRHRKQMFMSLMSERGIRHLCDLAKEEWMRVLDRWEISGKIRLQGEVELLLCRAVIRWVGIPLDDVAALDRTIELSAMIDGAGSAGPRNWRALFLRRRTERWARSLIRQHRQGRLGSSEETAIERIALHRDLQGNLLPEKTAGVELINLLRPTVAVARYITFAAMALHQHPEWAARLAGGDEANLENFVQEVRRFYPFFPMVGGRAAADFEWNGHAISKNTLVLLDLYGTNHDARLWNDPHDFNPDRFQEWDNARFNFIPQGGGDYHSGHRCPGEMITIGLIKMAVKRLVVTMDYNVPTQDLSIPLNRFPTLPNSGFVITRIKRK